MWALGVLSPGCVCVFFDQPSLASLSQMVALLSSCCGNDADDSLLDRLPRAQFDAAGCREEDHVCKRWQGAGDSVVTQRQRAGDFRCCARKLTLERVLPLQTQPILIGQSCPKNSPLPRPANSSTSALLVASSSRFDVVKNIDRISGQHD